ncbi:alcohol dehydrogenase catalytic domain-containing protein [Rubrobacter indicoceani]|uniref:alcohol dehydrogenase catalytic domain-containing protein n=1 Tax=Rubrobacter indicoceani TaxID=2051957 RepID=UPI000E5C47B7|nr:alcohol dehydrogenase catalytic domain-containing protein [Rubrobacter indicoceani]
MKSLVWLGPERMTVEERPEPEAEPGGVVLRVGAAGICGSEIEGYLGRMGNRTPPLVMGHEFAGTVVSVGEGVSDGWTGRRVTVNPLLSCGRCRLCRAGMDNLCPGRTMVGINHPGGFAEFVAAPESTLHEVPDSVSIRDAALAEPFANGVHVARLGLSRGMAETAVVFGGGTIGLMCLQALALFGVRDVSLVELHEGRRQNAKAFGASETFDSAEKAEEYLAARTDGLGADLVVDAVGAEATRRLGAGISRPGGTLVCIGLHDDETTLGFHDAIRRQVCVQGSYAYTQDDFSQAVEWLSSGEAGLGSTPVPLPLESGPGAFADLVKGPSDEVKVFLAEPEVK